MQVFVKGLSGRTVTLNVREGSTVDMVKGLLWERLRVPMEVQGLAFGGKELRDGLCLWDYGLGREATLHLLLRVKGGMPSEEDTLGLEDFARSGRAGGRPRTSQG